MTFTAAWTDIWQQQHDTSFVVAGAMKADLLADLHAAVNKAVSEGRGIAEFRRDFDALVAKNGWTGWTGQGTKAGEAWRTRVIFQTNLATSYAAGRWAQINDPEMADFMPYITYHHREGLAHPRPQHAAWNGLTLPKDHPFWKTHAVPNGWGCGCWLSGATRKDYDRAKVAGNTEPPEGWDAINPKTGAPVGIDKGWAYNPGASRMEELQRFAAEKAGKLPGQIGKDFKADVFPPALPAKGAPLIPEVIASKSVKEAEQVAANLLSDGVSSYPLRGDGTPFIRFAHGKTPESQVSGKYFGKADFSGMELDSCHAVNQTLRELQAECDRLGIPRLRGVCAVGGSSNCGDGVLSLTSSLKVKDKWAKVSSWRHGDSIVEQPGNVFQYSVDGNSVKNTMLHEFGHHIHQTYGVTTVNDYRRPILEDRLRALFHGVDTVFPSEYSKIGGYEEWFAESYVLLKIGTRSDLIDPRLIDLIGKLERGELI